MRERFRWPWRSRRARASQIDDELAFHLALRTEELEAGGLPAREARAQATSEFGDLAATRRYCLRQDAALDRRRRWADRLRDAAHDVRIAGRSLARRPALAGAVIATLALGVAGTTALWTVVHQLLLRPFDARDPSRVVVLWQANPQSGMFLSPRLSAIEIWRADATSFEAIEGIRNGSATLTGGEGAERLTTAAITETYLGFTGHPPMLGRGFRRDDRVPGAAPVALVSHGFWQRRFGGDPSVVGRVLRLDTVPRTIVGVLPRAFARPPGSWNPPDVWLPAPLGEPDGQALAVARLRPGVTPAEAQAELAVIDNRHQAVDPRFGTWRARLARGADLIGRGNARTLLLLFAAAGLVLLLSCANVSHLLLAWSVSRVRESAVRSALGGSGRRLVWQGLLEVGVLGVGGGLLGLLGAGPLLGLLIRFRPRALSHLESVQLDGRALAVSLGLGLGAALLAGLLPAWRLRRAAPAALFQTGRASAGSRAAWWRQTLIGFEVAVSVVILVAAGLVGRSLWRMQRADLGFAPDGLVAASWELPAWRFPTATARGEFHARVLAAARAEPGVEAGALASGIPPQPGIAFGELAIRGRDLRPAETASFFASATVSPSYFATMGIAILEGRGFDSTAATGEPGAVIINRAFARRYWPAGGAVGREIQIGGDAWLRIVGVVEDVPALGIGEERGALQLYAPLDPGVDYMTLVLRAPGRADAVGHRLRAIIRAADPAVPVSWVATARDRMKESMARQRFSGVVFGGFAVVALLLYAGGLFGVLNFAVTQRTREIGIRVALGADPGGVRRLVVRQTLVPTTLGILVGAGGAWVGARLVRSLLFEIPERDPLAFGLAVALTIVATVWASYRPARRATKLDPVMAMRDD